MCPSAFHWAPRCVLNWMPTPQAVSFTQKMALFSGCLCMGPCARLDGSQSQMFWGLDTQVQVLKVGVPDVRLKPFAPHGKALGCEFPPTWFTTLGGMGFMAQLSLASPGCFCVSLTQVVGLSQLGSPHSPPEETYSCRFCRLRIFLCYQFKLELPFL